MLGHGEGQVPLTLTPALPLGLGLSLVPLLSPFLSLELLFGPALSVTLWRRNEGLLCFVFGLQANL